MDLLYEYVSICIALILEPCTILALSTETSLSKFSSLLYSPFEKKNKVRKENRGNKGQGQQGLYISPERACTTMWDKLHFIATFMRYNASEEITIARIPSQLAPLNPFDILSQLRLSETVLEIQSSRSPMFNQHSRNSRLRRDPIFRLIILLCQSLLLFLFPLSFRSKAFSRS